MASRLAKDTQAPPQESPEPPESPGYRIVEGTLADLVPDEKNANQGTAYGQALIERSLAETGFGRSLILDRNNVIIGGNKTRQGAEAQGLTKVLIIETDGDTVVAHRRHDLDMNEGGEARRMALWDNQTAAANLNWDADQIKSMMAEGVDTDGIFSPDELRAIMKKADIGGGGVDPDADLDDVPDAAPTRCQPGDLWLLGQHRLLCGSSLEQHQWDRLMHGKTARLCCTDPPWNVGVGEGKGVGSRERDEIEGDDVPVEEFATFLQDFATITSAHLDGDIYCFMGASQWPVIHKALEDANFHWSATIVWVKHHFAMCRSNFHRRHEPIWYGWSKSGKSSFMGDRTLDDVWEFDRPTKSPEHPTMKPVGLLQKAIECSSVVGEIVIDPFLGSGTTLLAAANSGRLCYGFEIDPKHCDTVISRWEKATGQTATRDKSDDQDAPQEDR